MNDEKIRWQKSRANGIRGRRYRPREGNPSMTPQPSRAEDTPMYPMTAPKLRNSSQNSQNSQTRTPRNISFDRTSPQNRTRGLHDDHTAPLHPVNTLPTPGKYVDFSKRNNWPRKPGNRVDLQQLYHIHAIPYGSEVPRKGVGELRERTVALERLKRQEEKRNRRGQLGNADNLVDNSHGSNSDEGGSTSIDHVDYTGAVEKRVEEESDDEQDTTKPKVAEHEYDQLDPKPYDMEPELSSDDEMDEEEAEKEWSQRRRLRWFMDGPVVTILVIVIVLFALIIGILQMFGVEGTDGKFFKVVDVLITIFFTLEVAVRMYSYGLKDYFTSVLCVADVLCSLVDWIAIALASTDLDIIVFLRILRVARLTKISKIARLSEFSRTEEPPYRVDPEGRIYSYDPDHLFSIGWLTSISGSVIVMPEIWIQFLMLLIISFLFGTVICPIECDWHDFAYEADKDCDGCLVGIGQQTGLMFDILVVFLLGLFDTLTFDNWWYFRMQVNDVIEYSTDLGLMTCTWIPGSDPKSRAYRLTVIRYLNLSLRLFYKILDGDDHFDDLITERLVSQDELDMLKETEGELRHIQFSTLFWVQCLYSQIAVDGRMIYPGRSVHAFHKKLFQLQDHMDNIFGKMETQIPYTYTHLMTLVVKIHLLFTAFVAGTFIGQGAAKEDSLRVIWGFFIVLVSNMVLEGLLRIHVVLDDPFGDDTCDFPMPRYLDYVAGLNALMINNTNKMPFDCQAPMMTTAHTLFEPKKEYETGIDPDAHDIDTIQEKFGQEEYGRYNDDDDDDDDDDDNGNEHNRSDDHVPQHLDTTEDSNDSHYDSRYHRHDYDDDTISNASRRRYIDRTGTSHRNVLADREKRLASSA